MGQNKNQNCDYYRNNQSHKLYLSVIIFIKWCRLSTFLSYLRNIFIQFTATQQTIRPLLWVYDRSYTHKSGHLPSNMVNYNFLWSLKFFRFFCSHIQYLMVINFFGAKFFIPLVVNSYILWSLNFFLFVKIYMTRYLHK